MTKAEREKAGLKGSDKQQGALQDAPGDAHTPEGLGRERKGPYDKNSGRKETSQPPRVPGP